MASAGQVVTLVVTAANASPTVCTTAYRFSILGVDCFDTCIQDNLVKRFLQINQTSGGYLFTDCGKNVVAQGSGSASSYFCKTNYSGSGLNSSVSALFNPCTARGDANVIVAGQAYKIGDSNIYNNTCSCSQ